MQPHTIMLSELTLYHFFPDLRDDEQFFADHPGAVPISTQQVHFLFMLWLIRSAINILHKLIAILHKPNVSFSFKGEELKKSIGAAAYIECSAKSQQVCNVYIINPRSFG